MVAIAMKVRAGSREDTTVDLRAFLVLVAIAGGVARAEIEGAGLDARWSRALADVRTALADRADIDTSISIVVASAPPGVRVTARRANGDRADRDVDAIEDLGPSILALVVIPPRRPVVHARVEPAFDAELPGAPEVRVATPAPRSLGFAIGATVGMRWRGTTGIGGGAFAALARGSWLASASASWTTAGSDEAVSRLTVNTLELGIDVGRRIAVGPIELAGSFGPRMTRVTASLQDVEFSGTPTRYVVPELASLGLGGGLRVQWAAPARVHVFLGVEAGIDVTTRQTRDGAMDVVETRFVPLPQRAYGIGLVLGTTFEVAR